MTEGDRSKETPLSRIRVEARTADGSAECLIFRPASGGPFPGVLFYIDALGVRAAMEQMAERVARNGYVVLLPNLLYRAGDFAPFDPQTVWSDASERARLMAIIGQLDVAAATRDAGAWLGLLEGQPEVRAGGVGCMGYCLGGRLAFVTAGEYPEKVAACASIHGGRLVTPDADSPHKLAERIRASVYLGAADNDPSCTPEHQAELVRALSAAHVRYQLELYAGASHGFAVPDVPVYQAEAAERHWERVLALFEGALRRDGG